MLYSYSSLANQSYLLNFKRIATAVPAQGSQDRKKEFYLVRMSLISLI